MNKGLEVLLGFDFGTKRIGIAIGQTVTGTARPLGAINVTTDENTLFKNIKAFIESWQPDALIVGIPLNMDGSEQTITTLARSFAIKLKEHFQLPVFEMDERLTSVEARANVFDQGGYKALKKTSIDSVAAKVILENWLAQYDKK